MKTRTACKNLCSSILLLSAFFIYSCSNELEDNLSSKENKEFTLKLSVDEANALKIKKTGSYVISEEDAIEMVFKGFANEAQSRSKSSFVVKSCKKIDFPSTNKIEKDKKPEGYYVVDFIHENKEGFSIVSADKRIEQVLAYSEQGSLNDTIYNEGLKIFYQGLSHYMENQVKEFNTDSLYNAALSKLTFSRNGWIDDGNFHYYYAPYGFTVDSDYEYMGEEIITHEGDEIGNILTTKWYQTFPYNDKLPSVAQNQKAYAGCTLIAMIKIMAYYKKPYGSVTTRDWSIFTQAIQCYDEELQECILSIFNEIEKRYDTSGTYITLRSAQSFLNNNGYRTTYYNTYNSNEMILPVLVAGNDGTADPGHSWVIDSQRINTYATYDKYEKDDGYDVWRIYVKKIEEYGPLYVHCNWGLGGSSDGWYINNAFSSYNNFDYSHNLEMLNIQP
jgi:hypothetical protein